MSKYMRSAILLCFITLFLVGCGEKEKIGGYKYASYDTFASSTSMEYSYAGNKIYIEGTLTGFEMMDFDGLSYLIANIKEKDDKNWIVRIGQAGTCSDANLVEHIGKKVRCFGEYLKKQDNKAVMVLHVDTEYCIQTVKGDKTICSAENIKPTSIYVNKWYEDNAKEVIVEDVYDGLTKVKVPGAYISEGIIDSLDDGDDTFTLYQKKGDVLVYSFIHIDDDALCITPLQNIKKMKDGDAIKLYYVIDENKNMYVIDYCKTSVDYTYNKEDSVAQTVFEKTYDWSDGCSATYKVTYTESNKKNTIYVDTICTNHDTAKAALMIYINKLEESGMEYLFTMKIPSTNEGYTRMKLGKLSDQFWYDTNGEVSTDIPTWFSDTEISDECTLATMDILEIDKQFEGDYGDY